MKMRLILLRAALVLVGLALVWLLAGRQIAGLADQVVTRPAERLPVGDYVYSPTSLAIGGLTMDLFTPETIPVDIRGSLDAAGRLSLHDGGKVFALGTRIGPARTDGFPDVAFTADDGDIVTFTREHGALAWPTPFDINFVTGIQAGWRRNLYYRLNWRKRSGATFDIVWRFDEGLDRETGWNRSIAGGKGGVMEHAVTGPPR